jgi:rhamnosyltransferase
VTSSSLNHSAGIVSDASRSAPAPAISIVILVKNGRPFLQEVLEGVFRQEIEEAFEVIAIDSGSCDGSREIAARFPVTLLEIPSTEFNHGETRNLGARAGTGTYIVFLTQDATPGDRFWLKKLVQPLEEDPMVAGAFSSHRPRKQCPLMEKRQILETVLTSGTERRINVAVGNPEYERNPYPFIWFSNTSSCIRKDVWKKIPFRRLGFAEDQDWSKRALEAGFKTVYVPDSVVVHSHHYKPIKNFRRFFEHAQAMNELFQKREFPVFSRIFAATYDSVMADFRFFRSEGGSAVGFLRWVFPSLFWYLSAFTGLWLGTDPAKIPRGLREKLALQPSLMEK